MPDTSHNTPFIEPRLRYKPGVVDLGRPATFEDLDIYPEGLAVELIDGLMEIQPQPTNRHRFLQSRLNLMLNAIFDDGVGKLDGWLIMFEPEIRLEARALVPDVAGWRKDRAAHFSEIAHADVAPDWLCEILSPSTAKRDRTTKMDQYAAWGVQNMWIIDPELRTLESYRLVSDKWLLVKTYDDKGSVHIEPVLDAELDLDELWNLPFKK
ncbi:MAG: Uma2 family endonuclease [Pseudomonadota bacterium]